MYDADGYYGTSYNGIARVKKVVTCATQYYNGTAKTRNRVTLWFLCIHTTEKSLHYIIISTGGNNEKKKEKA